MMHRLKSPCGISVAIAMSSLLATAAVAQGANQQAIARAEALDACAGRPVVSAEVLDGGRLNVTCGDGETSEGIGNDLGGSGATALLLLFPLLLLGGLGSSGGT